MSLRSLRRRWFPTRDERRADGAKFAEDHFRGCMTEDEADMLYYGLPIEYGDPFDEAITDYYRELCVRLRREDKGLVECDLCGRFVQSLCEDTDHCGYYPHCE